MFQRQIVLSDVDIDGHTELDIVNASGVVTATTFEGNQVIGTPFGGFKSGAFTISEYGSYKRFD